MQVSSISFLYFCFFLFFLYYVLPKRFQWVLLLIFSAIFYVVTTDSFTWLYLLVSASSVYAATVYFDFKSRTRSSGQLERSKGEKAVLMLALAINIGILAVLKYSNFFIFNFNLIFRYISGGGWQIDYLNLLYSLGISYYTLQLISYLCDSYWGITKVQYNYAKLLLFAGYFPQMVSGPISRYSQISDDLYGGKEFDADHFVFGLQRITWGFIKKQVITWRIGSYVDAIFAAPSNYTSIHIWGGVLLFPIQLYTDFSGCMDIIMGVSECLGIKLPENFNAPFFSKNMQEFWQKWHITLGTWLRDYIMNPILKSEWMIKLDSSLREKLGKKRGKRFTSYIGMFFVWIAMGMWHGSGWKYIIGEGIWFWIVLVLEKEMNPAFKWMIDKWHIKTECFSWRLFQCLRTYIFFSIGMIFFRADTTSMGIEIIKKLFSLKDVIMFRFRNLVGFGLNADGWIICVIGVATVFLVDRLHMDGSVREALQRQNFLFRWLIYMVMIASILFFGQIGSPNAISDFIYQGF